MKQGPLPTMTDRRFFDQEKITNPPAAAGFIPLKMMKKFTLFCLLMLVAVGTLLAQGPVTYAGKVVVTDPLPASVSVPITVKNFQNVIQISLALDFDNTIMQYTGVTDVHPSLSGYVATAGAPAVSTVFFSWYGLAVIPSLPDDVVLFKANFTNYNGGTSLLTWNDSDPSFCEYAYPDGSWTSPFPDVPQEDYYKNGFVSQISAGYSVDLPACNNPNLGTITVTATGGSGSYIFMINDGTPVTNTTGVFSGLTSGTYAISLVDVSQPGTPIVLNPALTLFLNPYPGRIFNHTTSTYFCTLNDALAAAADNDELHFVFADTYPGVVFNTPKSVYLKNMTNGTVLIEGASPAVTLGGGILSFDGVSFVTATNDPTILINDGKLILRNCTITESPLFDQTGILVAGGELDAGITGDPGRNVFVQDGAGLAITQSGSAVANALCNYYGSVMYNYVSSRISGTVAFDPYNDASLNNCAFSVFDGPITYAGKVFTPAGNVQYPISVKYFNNVDAISLQLQFDNTNLTYVSISNLHPSLTTSPTVNVVGGDFYFAWNDNPLNLNGTTITPDSVKLFDINFISNTGTYPLTWNNVPTIQCEYQNALIQYPYLDEPTLDFYKNGFITDLSGTLVGYTDVICKGASDGTITVASSGGSYPNVIYTLTDGVNVFTNSTGLFTGVAPGTYSVTVTDGVYPYVTWTIATGIVINEPATALVGAGFESHRVRCKGESNGQAIMNASGGWGSIMYSIDGTNYQTLNFFDALSVNTYTLYARDAKGCVITDDVDITEPSIALTASGIESKVVTCKGGNDGQATLTGNNGWGGYWYSKDGLNFYLSPVLTGLSAGVNTLYLKDDGGCTLPVTVTITEPAVALAGSGAESKQVSCFGYADGEATITPVGGWGTYQFSKDNSTWQTSPVLTGYAIGTYTAYVKDLHGCVEETSPFTITQPDLLEGQLSGNNTVCYGVSSTVTIDITGGTQPYSFTITDGTTPLVVTGLWANQYTFSQAYFATTTWNWTLLTDVRNCPGTTTGTATITVNPLPVVTSVGLQTSVDQSTWAPVTGDLMAGYEMCIDPMIPYHYMDITNMTLANVPLETSSFVQNAFYLNTTSLPAGFYPYWLAKGVDGANNAGGWELTMWDIIQGTAPMLYISYDGSDFQLIDGLQYQVSGGLVVAPLRISGDYPQGLYTFTGTVLDENGCTSLPFDIDMQLNSSPVVTDVTLFHSDDQTNWASVAGDFSNGFEMCVDELVQYHYLDINTLTSGVNPLLANNFLVNPFFLQTVSLTPAYYAYWAAKGVDGVNNSQGWQIPMWNIINGNAPMFYINFDGTDYTLVDGLQYAIGQGAQTLRISNDYPQGTYTFTGVVTDVNMCVSSPFSINMTLTTMPQPFAGSDAVSCNNATYTLAAVPSVGTGMWTQTAGPGLATFGDATSATSTVTVDVAGAYTLTWTETNSICSRADDVVVTFLKGTVADAYNIAPISNIDAVAGAPVVTLFSYNLPAPDLNADANIIFDGLLSVDGGTFPAGAKIIEVRRVAPITTTYFKVFNGNIGGKDHVLLSDLLGVSFPLKSNTLNDYNWAITIEGIDGITTLDLEFSLITYITKPVDLTADCYAVLDMVDYSVNFDDATVTAADVEACLNDPLEFQISIEYPAINYVDLNNEITLDARITITNGGPFNSGATLLWGYNAPATNPSATNIDGKSSIYLSEIVGLPQFPMTGHSGTDVWNITINGLSVGIYDLNVQAVAEITVVEPPMTPLQIPGFPANPSNIYPAPAPADYVTYQYFYADDQLTLTVHPLPTITLVNADPKVCSGDLSVDFPYSATAFGADTYYIDFDLTAETAGFIDVYPTALPVGQITVTIPASVAGGVYNANLYVVNSVTGCISLAYPITINVPVPFSVSTGMVPVTCFGHNDGQASVNVTGSWGGYTYLWDDAGAQTTNPAVNLYAGTYNVVITDAEGCTTTATVVVTQPDVLAATIAKVDITCHGLTDGIINVTSPTGGYGTYEYRLDLGAWQPSGTFTGLAAGTYVVEIRDAYYTSCTMILGSLTIVEPAPNVVSGVFTYHNLANTPLNNVTVELQQSSVMKYTTITATNGSYSFPNVCPGTYEVVASTLKPTIGAVNSTDAVQVNIWGTASVKPAIQKVQFRAGDVVYSNSVLSNDAGRILQYFYQNGNPAFSVAPWVFWRANETINVNSFTEGLYPSINVGSSSITQNFYGLVSGDFNRSFTPGSAKSGGSITITNNGVLTASEGAEFDVPVSVNADLDVTAISLILNYPADKLEVIGVSLGNDLNTQVPYTTENGELRLGWYSAMPFMLNNGDVLVTLKVRALSALTNGESARFIAAFDQRNELAGNDYMPIASSVLNIQVIEGVVGVKNPVVVEQLQMSNFPNPFNGQTSLVYTLPVDGVVTLDIHDLAGRMITSLVSGFQPAGEHQVTLDATSMGAGIYTATISVTTSTGVYRRTIRIANTK